MVLVVLVSGQRGTVVEVAFGNVPLGNANGGVEMVALGEVAFGKVAFVDVLRRNGYGCLGLDVAWMRGAHRLRSASERLDVSFMIGKCICTRSRFG